MKALLTTLLCLIVLACGNEQKAENSGTKNPSKPVTDVQPEKKKISLNDQIRCHGISGIGTNSDAPMFSICFENLSGKTIKAFKFTIKIKDDFGEVISEENFTVDSNIEMSSDNNNEATFLFKAAEKIHYTKIVKGSYVIEFVSSDKNFQKDHKNMRIKPDNSNKKFNCEITAIVFK